MTTAVFYSYKDYPDSAKNLDFFVRNSADLDVNIFISYNSCIHYDINKLPSNYLAFKVDFNIDFVDWAILLDLARLDDFDGYVFMNSSCIGPILPNYCSSNWISLLRSKLVGDVHAVAPVIEIPPDSNGLKIIKNFKYLSSSDKCIPFMHTYFVYMDRYAVDVLISNAFFTKTMDKDSAIDIYERGMTSILINHGINVCSLMRASVCVNFLDKRSWSPELLTFGRGTCPEIPGNYYGADLNMFELMFFKNIRHPNAHRSGYFSGISIENSKYIDAILYSR